MIPLWKSVTHVPYQCVTYVCLYSFLDADDVYAPSLFKAISRIIAEKPYLDVVKYETATFSDGDEYPWLVTHEDEPILEEKVSGTPWTISEAYCYFGCRFYRRDVIGDTRFESFKIGEDTLFLINCLLKCKSMITTTMLGYGYRMRKTSVSHEPISLAVCMAHPELMTRFFTLAEANEDMIAPDLLRLWVNSATESFNGMIRGLPKRLRAAPWALWKERMVEWSQCNFIKGFNMVRMKLFCCLPFKIVATIIYYLPNKLKVMGFHR